MAYIGNDDDKNFIMYILQNSLFQKFCFNTVPIGNLYRKMEREMLHASVLFK